MGGIELMSGRPNLPLSSILQTGENIEFGVSYGEEIT